MSAAIDGRQTYNVVVTPNTSKNGKRGSSGFEMTRRVTKATPRIPAVSVAAPTNRLRRGTVCSL